MDQPRPEVLVATTLHVFSALLLDPSPCPCRIRALVAHLDRMMQTVGMDPVLRATAIALHDAWHRVALGLPAASPEDPPTAPPGRSLH